MGSQAAFEQAGSEAYLFHCESVGVVMCMESDSGIIDTFWLCFVVLHYSGGVWDMENHSPNIMWETSDACNSCQLDYWRNHLKGTHSTAWGKPIHNDPVACPIVPLTMCDRSVKRVLEYIY